MTTFWYNRGVVQEAKDNTVWLHDRTPYPAVQWYICCDSGRLGRLVGGGEKSEIPAHKLEDKLLWSGQTKPVAKWTRRMHFKARKYAGKMDVLCREKDKSITRQKARKPSIV